MKQTELQKCAICAKGMMHDGQPWFYRLSIDQMVIDARAVQRQHGLEQVVGNARIAHALGPQEDMAQKMAGVTICVCAKCALMESLPVAVLMDVDHSETEEKGGDA